MLSGSTEIKKVSIEKRAKHICGWLISRERGTRELHTASVLFTVGCVKIVVAPLRSRVILGQSLKGLSLKYHVHS